MGFEPGQTDPPYYTQYCPDGDACQVGMWQVPPTNFVDFADFLDWESTIAKTHGTKIGQGVDPADNDPIGYYTANCSYGVKRCPTTATWGIEYGPGETPYQMVYQEFLALWQNGTVTECFADPEAIFPTQVNGSGPCQ